MRRRPPVVPEGTRPWCRSRCRPRRSTGPAAAGRTPGWAGGPRAFAVPAPDRRSAPRRSRREKTRWAPCRPDTASRAARPCRIRTPAACRRGSWRKVGRCDRSQFGRRTTPWRFGRACWHRPSPPGWPVVPVRPACGGKSRCPPSNAPAPVRRTPARRSLRLPSTSTRCPRAGPCRPNRPRRPGSCQSIAAQADAVRRPAFQLLPPQAALRWRPHNVARISSKSWP